jgi:hypothetical protein
MAWAYKILEEGLGKMGLVNLIENNSVLSPEVDKGHPGNNTYYFIYISASGDYISEMSAPISKVNYGG